MMFRSAGRWVAAAALTFAVASSAWAADASGKWQWVTRFRDNEITTNAEFKQEGEKLTGTVTGRNGNKTEIKEGTVKGSDVSFVVVRMIQDREIKQTFKGKLEGETIKGKITMPGRDGGQGREVDWEAKRPKEEKK